MLLIFFITCIAVDSCVGDVFPVLIVSVTQCLPIFLSSYFLFQISGLLVT